MRTIFNFIKAILLLSLCSLALLACSKPIAHDSHGKAIEANQYKNKWLVINYWANWCEPCLREMPNLNALYQNHQTDIMIIGVNFDGIPNEEINAFAKKLNISFPLTRDFPIEKYGITSIATLPVTFIISPKGKLIAKLDGPQTQEAILQHLNIKY